MPTSYPRADWVSSQLEPLGPTGREASMREVLDGMEPLIRYDRQLKHGPGMFFGMVVSGDEHTETARRISARVVEAKAAWQALVRSRFGAEAELRLLLHLGDFTPPLAWILKRVERGPLERVLHRFQRIRSSASEPPPLFTTCTLVREMGARPPPPESAPPAPPAERPGPGTPYRAASPRVDPPADLAPIPTYALQFEAPVALAPDRVATYAFRVASSDELDRVSKSARAGAREHPGLTVSGVTRSGEHWAALRALLGEIAAAEVTLFRCTMRGAPSGVECAVKLQRRDSWTVWVRTAADGSAEEALQRWAGDVARDLGVPLELDRMELA